MSEREDRQLRELVDEYWASLDAEIKAAQRIDRISAGQSEVSEITCVPNPGLIRSYP